MEELPNYMRIIYQSVLDTFEYIDQEMKLRGKFGTMQPIIDDVSNRFRVVDGVDSNLI